MAFCKQEEKSVQLAAKQQAGVDGLCRLYVLQNRKYDKIELELRFITNKEGCTMTKEQAWAFAIGLIKVDDLEPTPDFLEMIEREKRDDLTMDDLYHYLNRKYGVKEEVANA